LRPSSSLRDKEIQGRRRFRERIDVLACKPEELFLAVSQVEQQLALNSVKVLNGRKEIPIVVSSIMSSG
jgi:hypothetical protein